MTEQDKSRAEFEAWASAQNWIVHRDTFGEYVYSTARDGWAAWQAARALPADAAPSGWRTIESFQKELRFTEGSNCYSASAIIWRPGLAEPIRAKWWWRTDSDACNFLADGGYAVFPTLWQPLPAAPDA